MNQKKTSPTFFFPFLFWCRKSTSSSIRETNKSDATQSDRFEEEPLYVVDGPKNRNCRLHCRLLLWCSWKRTLNEVRKSSSWTRVLERVLRLPFVVLRSLARQPLRTARQLGAIALGTFSFLIFHWIALKMRRFCIDDTDETTASRTTKRARCVRSPLNVETQRRLPTLITCHPSTSYWIQGKFMERYRPWCQISPNHRPRDMTFQPLISAIFHFVVAVFRCRWCRPIDSADLDLLMAVFHLKFKKKTADRFETVSRFVFWNTPQKKISTNVGFSLLLLFFFWFPFPGESPDMAVNALGWLFN